MNVNELTEDVRQHGENLAKLDAIAEEDAKAEPNVGGGFFDFPIQNFAEPQTEVKVNAFDTNDFFSNIATI